MLTNQNYINRIYKFYINYQNSIISNIDPLSPMGRWYNGIIFVVVVPQKYRAEFCKCFSMPSLFFLTAEPFNESKSENSICKTDKSRAIVVEVRVHPSCLPCDTLPLVVPRVLESTTGDQTDVVSKPAFATYYLCGAGQALCPIHV